jgi:hypothetical protein
VIHLSEKRKKLLLALAVGLIVLFHKILFWK